MKHERAVREVTLYLTRDDPRVHHIWPADFSLRGRPSKGKRKGILERAGSAMGARFRAQILFAPYLSNAACHTE